MARKPAPLFGSNEALAFLQAAFSGLPERRYVVLWQLDGKQSVSFTDLERAAEWAGGRDDVYVHVGIADRAYLGGHRIKAAEVAGIVGCWADIDIADPVHKKAGLPESEAAARIVADSTGLVPSVLVHSGHGLQAWWLLDEPWLFESSDERRRAATLVRAWDLSLRERARRIGWTLDAVGDLSRLLRIPGTRNCKALPAAVRIDRLNPQRYGIDDLEGALIESAWKTAEHELGSDAANGAPVADDGDLVLNPAAQPPNDLMFALVENEPQFMATWNRTRRDTKTKTWSASEYDLSLAHYAAAASWDRQQIANLLIAGRRKHGDDLKLRQDYYAATIAKAQADAADRDVIHEAVSLGEEALKAGPDEPAVDKAELLARVCKAVSVPITRLVRTTSEPPSFRIETPHGNGPLGSIESILENRKFRAKVAEITNRAPRRFKSEIWDPLAQCLLQAADTEPPSADTTTAGKVDTWVSLYLAGNRPQKIEDLNERGRGTVAQSMPPHMGEDGRIRIFATGFRQWLILAHRELLTANEVGSMLRAYGCEPETRHFSTEAGRTSRALWVLPRRGDGGTVDR